MAQAAYPAPPPGQARPPPMAMYPPPPGPAAMYPPPPGLAVGQPVYGQPVGGAYNAPPMYQVQYERQDDPNDTVKGCLATSCFGCFGCTAVFCFCNTPRANYGAAMGCVVFAMGYLIVNAIFCYLIFSDNETCWLGKYHEPFNGACAVHECDTDGCKIDDFKLYSPTSGPDVCRQFDDWSCIGVWPFRPSFKYDPILRVVCSIIAIAMSLLRISQFRRMMAQQSNSSAQVPLTQSA